MLIQAEAKGAGKQISKAIEIFKLDDKNKSDYNNQKDIEDFINYVSPIIHKTVGKNDFKADRLNKIQRKESGLDMSKRNYNKKWRLLIRIEKKLLKFIRESKKIEFQNFDLEKNECIGYDKMRGPALANRMPAGNHKLYNKTYEILEKIKLRLAS